MKREMAVYKTGRRAFMGVIGALVAFIAGAGLGLLSLFGARSDETRDAAYWRIFRR
jgi:hypothetical protein